MADLTIREIYERHIRGDLNTTTDLIAAAQHFEQLEWRANTAGPVFQLAAVEAGRVARAMREFVTSRRHTPGIPASPRINPLCGVHGPIPCEGAGCICTRGVPASVPINRPATMEEAKHAAQIGACLPNGVLFDAFGRQRVRYVRITLDGAHLIMHPNELAAWKANEENPDQFTYADVYLSEEEADALPEFDGF